MSLNIILVDQKRDVSAVAILLEKEYDCRVDISEDVSQALAKIERKKYDAVIVETFDTKFFRTPQNPFIDFVRQVKTQQIPVVLATAMDKPELKRNNLARGRDFDGYVLKPYRVEDLYKEISSVVQVNHS